MAFLVGVLGLLVGSFLNVCIYRLPRHESIFWPGSHCPACGHPLGPLDLIPVLSWVWLGGRCRYCQAPVSGRYTAVELITAGLFGLVYLRFGWHWETVVGLIFAAILVVLAFTDLETGLLPNAVTLPGTAIGLVLSLARPGWTPITALWGAALVGGVLLLIAVASGGKMGGGDVKMGFLMGAFLGPLLGLVALFMSSSLGALTGLGLMATGRVRRGEFIPFGPFLSLGSLITLFFGQAILAWYLSLIQL
ncbi:MAG: prepilin peptidase [Bacillota bacterium]